MLNLFFSDNYRFLNSRNLIVKLVLLLSFACNSVKLLLIWSLSLLELSSKCQVLKPYDLNKLNLAWNQYRKIGPKHIWLTKLVSILKGKRVRIFLMILKLIEILCPFFLAYFAAELIAPNARVLLKCGPAAWPTVLFVKRCFVLRFSESSHPHLQQYHCCTLRTQFGFE